MEMREITVPDGRKYIFTTSSFNVSNPLGVIKATLVEYVLYKADNIKVPIGKLYRTNDGNWYDAPTDKVVNSNLATVLKMAIDETVEINPIS